MNLSSYSKNSITKEDSPSIHQVVSGGYCVGCGACAAVSDGSLKMSLQRNGTYVPVKNFHDESTKFNDEKLASACPFSSRSISEDKLAATFLPDAIYRNSEIGNYIESNVMHVASEALRASSSSGGVARWLLAELLDQGHVTHVAHVVSTAPADLGGALFEFSLTSDSNALVNSAKSAYYPVSLEEIIPAIKDINGTVAITAIPCFAKSIRQICLQDPELRSKVKVIVGIICGHMKSRAFGELLAWQVGVKPSQLGGVDFRLKLPNLPANHKGFSAYNAETGNWTHPVDTKGLVGGDWGLGLMKNHACEFCDDVLAEVADVSIGDAWLPEYTSNPKGHSIVVIRSPLIKQVVHAGLKRGDLEQTSVDANTVARSQAGGLRHRREGLSFRLSVAQKKRLWHPPKRVSANTIGIPRSRQKIYSLRYLLAVESLKAFSKAKSADSLQLFYDEMAETMAKYKKIASPSWRRILSPVKRVIPAAILKRLRGK